MHTIYADTNPNLVSFFLFLVRLLFILKNVSLLYLLTLSRIHLMLNQRNFEL